MVVDSSAIIAILLAEPDAELFSTALAGSALRLMSAVTRVELSFVIEGRKGEAGRQALEHFLSAGAFEIISVTPAHANLAIDAFRRYGKGRHPAALNIGDCFAYALATATAQPLLFKGQDFAKTNIQSALFAS